MPKVLLVEDNETNRDMLSRRLQRRGYDVIWAVDGREAVRVSEAEQPDVVLMDMMLPGMSGSDATRAIRANAATKDIGVIALTAFAMTGDRERALDAGCDDYDVKPVDLLRLLGKIERLLARRRGDEEVSR